MIYVNFFSFLSVRLCENRLSLIEEGLQAQKGSYRHGSRLLQLATLLRVCGDDSKTRQAKVLTLVAQAALKVGEGLKLYIFSCIDTL